jgi:homoserine O-acetyltransferase
VRKPHLSKLHLDSALLAQATELPASVPTPFIPPVAPQIPRRRRPAFSPGGFGLTSKPVPRAPDIMGLGRQPPKLTKPPSLGTEEGTPELRAAVTQELERRDREIARDEERLEGSEKEAEACYIVRKQKTVRIGRVAE